MSDGAVVEIKGLGRLVSTMRKAGLDVTELKRANTRAGEIVATRGRQVAPQATGRLSSSIRPARQARRARVVAGGGGIRYARYQEFGTRKNPARHYLYGSAEQTQPQWLAAYQ